MAGIFSKLGLGKTGENGVKFRPMKPRDLDAVLKIIYDHDEDDGEDAEESFAEGLDQKFVLDMNGEIVGMTGYTRHNDGDNIAWLSWSYIRSDMRRRGLAMQMMLDLREVLLKYNYRRLFIATSDYVDEDTGQDIYQAARKFYQHKLNATPEIVLKDFYAPGESKYIYSLPVSDVDAGQMDFHKDMIPSFEGIELGDETETTYVVLWNEVKIMGGEKGANPDRLISDAAAKNAHVLFLSIPAHLNRNIEHELVNAGFSKLGKISDYYAPGLDDIYWGHYFED